MSSGAETVGGAELVIVSTNTGLYKIEARGEGASPKLTEEHFTNLPAARRAIERYTRANAATINKKRIMTEGIARREAAREAALELKNGALDNTVNGKESKRGKRPNE